MKLLSIIVPIYNVELYLERCIRSLEDQDIPIDDYEIICINDGSPDNSRQVIERLQMEFNNILLINQENKGVAVARNNGMKLASGRYLLMVDADDYVERKSFERVLKIADHNDFDVFVLGYRILNTDDSVRRDITYTRYSNKVYDGCSSYFICLGDGRSDPNRLSAVFNSKFLKENDLFYLPNVPFLEDGELMVRILALAERCGFDNRILYIRTNRPGSAVNSTMIKSDKTIYGFFLSTNNLIQFRNEKCIKESQKRLLNHGIVKYITLPVNIFAESIRTYPRAYGLYKFAKQNIANKLNLEGCNITNRIFGTGYNSSFILFILLRECYYLAGRISFIINKILRGVFK